MPRFVPLSEADAAPAQEPRLRFVPLADANQLPDDAPAAQRPLPDKVAPANAGAGRGSAQDPRRLDAPAEPLVMTSDAMGTGAAEILAQPTRPQSVLEGVDLPEPTVTPGQEAENAMLSRRAYAEQTPTLDDPRRSGPRLEPASTSRGDAVRAHRVEDVGSALSDAPLPVRAAAKAVTGGVQGLAGTVRAGADIADAAGVPGAREVGRFASGAAEGAKDFERGMGDGRPAQDFGPGGPVPYLAKQAEGAASSLGTSAAFAVAFGPKAVIPLMSLQSAGQQYQQARQQGMDPATALANAVPHGAFEAIGEKFQGLDKAAAALRVLMTRGAPASSIKSAGEVLISAGIREVPGEVITYLGQSGIDKLPGIGLNPNMSVEQFIDGLRDTVVQASMMGGASVAGGAAATMRARQPAPEQTPEQLARAKGFLAMDEQAKRLREAGEKEIAGTIQRQADNGRAEDELANLASQPWGADADFQGRYRELRAKGVKPAEAAARASMASTFGHVAGGLGIAPEVAGKALDAAATLPIEKVPTFFEKFTAVLVKKGISQPIPEGTVSGAVGGVRDAAVASTLDTVYGERPAAAQAVDNIAKLVGATTAPASPESAIAAPVATQSEDASAAAPAEDGGKPLKLLSTNDAGAHMSHSSPLNDLEASKAQILAGNAPLGHMKVGGLDYSVENAEGSVRSDLQNEPPKWKTPMEHGYHYGYFKRTEGNDGDHVDAFVKTGTPESYDGPVFVVDQVDPKSGKFDEHKVVIGAASREEALDAYGKHYEAGWKGGAAVTELPMPEFKKWVRDGKKTEPLGLAVAGEGAAPGQAAQADPGRQNTGAAVERPAAAGAPAAPGDAAPPAVAPLRLGITPNDAAPVTVRDGVVHIGEEPAINFDSGEPIELADGSTDAQIRRALVDAGAVSRRQKFFGGQKQVAKAVASSAESSVPAPAASDKAAAESGESAAQGAQATPTPIDKAALKRQSIELRKRIKVLEKLRACVAGG